MTGSSDRRSTLSLHLGQISLVYVNTLMIHRLPGEDRRANAMSSDDLRTLCPRQSQTSSISPAAVQELHTGVYFVCREDLARFSPYQTRRSMRLGSQ
jgi:hypothetical protein